MSKSITAPMWDLSDLYSSLEDPKIAQDMARLEEDSLDFATKYRGQLPHNISGSDLKNVLEKYETILQETTKLAVYAHLNFSTHTEKPEIGSFLQKIQSWSINVSNNLLFFELEILDIPQTKLKALVENPDLKDYKHYLRKEIARKPHRLPESQENILNQKSLTGRQAFIRLFTQRTSTRSYSIKIDNKVKKISQSAALDLMYSSNRQLREDAGEALNKGLQEDSDINTYIFNVLAADHAINTKLRKFSSPEAARHLDNEVDQSTVDTLADVVTDNYKLVQDYYKFKGDLLGYKELFEYDRYAPLATTSKKFTFEEAQDIVLSSFRAFSPEFADIAQKFFDNNWIDAATKDGKQGGAYCMYTTPKDHPYVFMNYNGNINDVITLAHELGHAVHGYLARKQTYLHYDWPLTISETASVFAEMLVFQTLKKQLKSNEDKLSLYTSRIEAMFATVFRQISMYKFEQKFHKQHSDQGELSTENANMIWRETQEAMFGKSVTLTKNENLRWSYVPHFIHTPFYVYSYAFGELLTMSLYALYEKHPENFVDNYMALLTAGGSKSPEELLQPFSIDINSKKFWQGGVDEIKNVFEEAKQLAKK